MSFNQYDKKMKKREDPPKDSRDDNFQNTSDYNYTRLEYTGNKKNRSNGQSYYKGAGYGRGYRVDQPYSNNCNSDRAQYNYFDGKDNISNHTKSYKNKVVDKIEQNSNLNYETQESFFKNLNVENSVTRKNINSSESIKPVPFPRTVKKSDDEDGKGTRKKQKGNNDKDRFDAGICMSCEKVVTSRELHKDHRVLPVDNGIVELKERNQNKIVTAIEEINLQLDVEMQTKGIINLFEPIISPSLSNVFKELKTTNDYSTKKLNQIRDSGMQIMGNSSMNNITDMIKLINLQSDSQNIFTQNQKLLSDLKQNSCWLIFSWFKTSIGLILQSGVKIFAVIKSQSSAIYASFDLYGERLRLFSFKRGITPKKDAMIFPFEPISALFKNEDSKSFMILANNNNEGQVILRINKETFWGQQFNSLCLGNLGPSLRNMNFFRSCGRGKQGHHIWGGDYSKNDGSGGESFFPWNEPLKPNPEVIVKGLLAARYGHNDKSTIFRLYIEGIEQTSDPPIKEGFSFGYVEEGMETLEYFANQSDITKASIKDAGCLLVLK